MKEQPLIFQGTLDGFLQAILTRPREIEMCSAQALKRDLDEYISIHLLKDGGLVGGNDLMDCVPDQTYLVMDPAYHFLAELSAQGIPLTIQDVGDKLWGNPSAYEESPLPHSVESLAKLGIVRREGEGKVGIGTRFELVSTAGYDVLMQRVDPFDDLDKFIQKVRDGPESLH